MTRKVEMEKAVGGIIQTFTTLYKYNAFNKVEEITDSLGNKSLFTYDVHGNLAGSKNAEGRTIINSNRSIKEWVDVFAGDHMAATAILVRLFHKSTLFNIDGNSYHLKNFNKVIREIKTNEN